MSRADTGAGVKAVSLFSGLGGLDIGLHRIGIETVACVEQNGAAAETLKINSVQHDTRPPTDHVTVHKRYPWTVFDKDIRHVDAEDILKEAGVDRSDIDLVVGGPPCQTFSRSNEGSRSGTDTARGRLYKEFTRILHQIEPDAFIFENVRGLKSANDGKDLEVIQDALEADTYTSDFKVLNAADYGVPQTRKRIFIIGTSNQQNPQFPPPTHSESGANGTTEWVKAGEALEEFDIDEEVESNGGYRNAIGSKYGTLLKDIPEGANYQHFSDRKYDTKTGEYIERNPAELDEKRFDWRSRHWNYLLKIDQKRPSWTIQADPGTTVGPFHWRARKLSLLEQMKLMGLPLDYFIAGSPGQVQQQIGNAVPPALATAIARELVTCLGLNPRSSSRDDPTDQGADGGAPGQVPFTIEVETEDSPWIQADRILNTILTEEACVIRARQRAIPFALDALEIARRHAQAELTVDVEEKILTDSPENDGVVSELVAEVVTARVANISSSGTRSVKTAQPETQ